MKRNLYYPITLFFLLASGISHAQHIAYGVDYVTGNKTQLPGINNSVFIITNPN